MDYFESMSSWDYKHMTADQKRDELKQLIDKHIKNIKSAQGREQVQSRVDRITRWTRELASMECVLASMPDSYYDEMNGTRFNVTPCSRIDYYTQEI